MSGTISFNAMAERVVSIDGLSVRSSLFGAIHAFMFREHQVRVIIPHVKMLSGNVPEGEVASRASWRADDPENPEKTWFMIHRLRVEVDLQTALHSPSRVFEVRSNAYELFNDKQAEKNTRLVDKYDGLLLAAFEHWKKVIRWITQRSALGLPRSGFNDLPEPTHGTRILRRDDRRTFWIMGGQFTVRPEARLNPAAWALAQKAFDENEAPPIWFIYLSEAEQRAWTSDLNNAILACAVACETVVRANFWLNFGMPVSPTAVDIVDRIAAQALIHRWADLAGLTTSEAKQLPLGNVHKIFDLRNKIIHQGISVLLEQGTVKSLIRSCRTFILDGDARYRKRKGLPERIIIVGEED